MDFLSKWLAQYAELEEAGSSFGRFWCLLTKEDRSPAAGRHRPVGSIGGFVWAQNTRAAGDGRRRPTRCTARHGGLVALWLRLSDGHRPFEPIVAHCRRIAGAEA